MSTVARPLVSLVMFDSQVPTYHGRAVYLSATATRLAGRDFDRGIGIIPGPATRGGSPVTADDVTAPSPYRLYHATVTEAFVLCPREPRQPCPRHSINADHRTPVVPWRHVRPRGRRGVATSGCGGHVCLRRTGRTDTP